MITKICLVASSDTEVERLARKFNELWSALVDEAPLVYIVDVQAPLRRMLDVYIAPGKERGVFRQKMHELLPPTYELTYAKALDAEFNASAANAKDALLIFCQVGSLELLDYCHKTGFITVFFQVDRETRVKNLVSAFPGVDPKEADLLFIDAQPHEATAHHKVDLADGLAIGAFKLLNQLIKRPTSPAVVQEPLAVESTP